MIGAASTNVLEGDFHESAGYILAYGALQFGGSLFKELQGLLYMKVSQEAFVHLSDYTFGHIHKLSLEWHLHKKTGEGELGLICLTSYRIAILTLICSLSTKQSSGRWTGVLQHAIHS